jgi:hypothetical protein
MYNMNRLYLENYVVTLHKKRKLWEFANQNIMLISENPKSVPRGASIDSGAMFHLITHA